MKRYVLVFVFALGVLACGQVASAVPGTSPTTSSETAKAASPDEAAIRNVADQLYTHVFKSSGQYPKMEPIKHLFVDALYALILPESLRKVETEDDVSALQFIPGNGGAETFALQAPEIQGSLATIAVIFDGMDGRNGQPTHKVLLQLERQKDDRWLIANIFEHYDGQLLSWMGRSAPEADAAAGKTSERLCGGKVLAKGGVVLRESSNRKAKEICKIPAKAELDILSMDGPEEKIEDVTGKWFSVRWNSPQGKKEGWVFGGFIEVSPSKDASTAAPVTDKAQMDKTQWIGQKTDDVAKKLGLVKRESRDIDSEGTYGLELYGTADKVTTVFFGKSIGKTPDGYHIYQVLDLLVLPALTEPQFFSHCADVKEKRDDQLFGIGINDKKETTFKKSEKVWRANTKSGKIEDMSADGVTLATSTE